MPLENSSVNDGAYPQQSPVPAQVAPSAASALRLKGLNIPDDMRHPTIKQLNQEHPDYTEIAKTNQGVEII